MKKTAALLCALLALAALTGCGARTAQNTAQTTPQSLPQSSAPPAQSAPLELQRLEELPGITREGFYVTEPALNGSDAMNLMYADFSSAAKIHLCASANCTHTGPECDSWLPANGGGCRPMMIGDRLVLTMPGASFYNDELGESSFPQIMTMSPDGKDKKTLVTFGAAQELFDPYLTDGTNLYCMLETTEAQQVKRELIRIDLSTGQWEALYELDTERNEQLQDAFGSCVLLSSLGQNMDDTIAEGTVTTVFSRLDLSTGEKQVIFSPSSGDTVRVFRGRELYYYSLSENALHCLDCETLADEVIKQPVFEGEFDPQYADLMDCRDGHALLRLFAPDSNDFSLLQVDLATGESSAFTLTLTDIMGTERPVRILAAIPGTSQYLVKAGEEKVTCQTTQPDGTPLAATTARTVYGIIDAADYWASNPAYRTISNAG